MSHRYSRVEDATASENLRLGTRPFAFMRTSLSGVVILALAASAAATDLAVGSAAARIAVRLRP